MIANIFFSFFFGVVAPPKGTFVFEIPDKQANSLEQQRAHLMLSKTGQYFSVLIIKNKQIAMTSNMNLEFLESVYILCALLDDP